MINADNTEDLLFSPCSQTCGIGTRVVFRTRGCPNGEDQCFLRMEQCKELDDCKWYNILLSNTFWHKNIWFLIPAAILLLFGLIIGVICIIICGRRKNNKSKTDVTSQNSTDTDKESTANHNEEQEEKITDVNDDAPPGPVDEKRDDLKNINISLPGPGYVIIKMDKDDNHGPVDEKRDDLKNINISLPGPGYVIIKMDKDDNVNISSDRKQEDEIRIVNDAANHGPMAEKRDVLENTSISTPKPNDVVINMNLDKDVIISSDRKQEGETHIVNCAAHHRPEAEKRNVFQNANICRPGPSHAAINRSPNEKLDLSQPMGRGSQMHRCSECPTAPQGRLRAQSLFSPKDTTFTGLSAARCTHGISEFPTAPQGRLRAQSLFSPKDATCTGLSAARCTHGISEFPTAPQGRLRAQSLFSPKDTTCTGLSAARCTHGISEFPTAPQGRLRAQSLFSPEDTTLTGHSAARCTHGISEFPTAPQGRFWAQSL
ncbi:uncharacterized protein ACNLHF_012918 [Anomaloglossus baeobatrachus]